MIQQILVVAPNAPGTLTQITTALAKAGINLVGIEANSAHELGTLTIRVADKVDQTLQVLSELGFSAVHQDVLIIQLHDHPGALASVANRLSEAGIDLRSIHFLRRHNGHALVCLSTSNDKLSAQLLADILVANSNSSQ